MYLKSKLLSVLLISCMVYAGVGCESLEDDSQTVDLNTDITYDTTLEVKDVTTTESMPIQNPTVNITVEGDNLIHSSIYNQANARADYNGYDFSYAYERVEQLFTGDLNIMNQETLICNDEYPPADYPCFNSPVDLGNHMIDIGINVFSIANNHMIDMGADGLSACLDYWDSKEQYGILHYGAYRDESDMQNIVTTEVNGISFAFVAFTEYTNGLSLPTDSPLQIVYTSEMDRMQSQVELADELADVVVVSVHWGSEDTHEVDDYRRTLAQNFADWGANLIIGTHSHTVQSMEYITNKYGDEAFVFYSLGNFISAQSDNFNLVGLVGDLNVTKDLSSGSIIIDNIKARPVITHYGYGYSDVQVYPYFEYDDDLASQHGIHTAESGNYHDFSMEVIDEILTQNVPSEFLYLE
ncbi:MAG: CapA family protein [Ruminococcus sp.]|nr:CapA family protein [Ruminococcus sp.]